jgi:glutamine amidotransferase
MIKKIAIINYSTNNLLSIQRALIYNGFDSEIINDSNININKYELFILPGVGAFNEAKLTMQKKGFWSLIEKIIEKNKKLFCICLGMQLLFEESFEFGLSKGLGYFKGSIKPFLNNNKKRTLIGWNDVFINKSDNFFFENTTNKYYFCHSFFADKFDQDCDFIGTSSFVKQNYISVIKKKNVFATQFHPEKSSHAGLKLINKIFENI